MALEGVGESYYKPVAFKDVALAQPKPKIERYENTFNENLPQFSQKARI
jgi:hypothetical protein